MTREEAITILTETQVVYFAPNGKEKVQEALNMAIEALQLGQKAEYIIPSGDVIFISAGVRCDEESYCYIDGQQTVRTIAHGEKGESHDITMGILAREV